MLAECSDRICFRKKKKRKKKEPRLLEAERVRMYSLDSVCACVWDIFKVTDLHGHTGHDKQS